MQAKAKSKPTLIQVIAVNIRLFLSKTLSCFFRMSFTQDLLTGETDKSAGHSDKIWWFCQADRCFSQRQVFILTLVIYSANIQFNIEHHSLKMCLWNQNVTYKTSWLTFCETCYPCKCCDRNTWYLTIHFAYC